MNNCYICEKDGQTVLYYSIDDLTYINPKKTNIIPNNAKSICKDCSPKFILERQLHFSCCAICKAYNISPEVAARVTNNQKEIHSHVNECYSMDLQMYSHIKDNDLICLACFEKLKKNQNVNKIDMNYCENKTCCLCDQELIKKEDDWYENYGGRVLTDKIFSLNSKVYEITDNIILPKNGIICFKCLESINNNELLGTECSLCKNKYPSDEYGYPKEPCRWIIHDKIICKRNLNCNDIILNRRTNNPENVLEFVHERPKHMEYKKLICDNCVSKLIEDKICVYKK